MVHYPIAPYAAPRSFLGSGIAALAGAGGFIARQGVVDTIRYAGERLDDLTHQVRRWTGPYVRADRTIRSLANSYAGRALLPSYSRTSRSARPAKARGAPPRRLPSSSKVMTAMRRSTKSYGRGRVRARYAPRFRRRVVRKGRWGLRKYTTATQTSRLIRCESVQAAVIVGQASGGSTANAYNYPAAYLGMQCITAGTDGVNAGGANCYVIIGSLQHLYTSNQPFMQAYANLYEFVKCNKLSMRLMSPFTPIQMLQQAIPTSATQLNLAFLPLMDNNVSWIERDGYFELGSQIAGTWPVNGDMTSLVRGRYGAKNHQAFKNIYRTVVPTMLQSLDAFSTSAGSYLNPSTSNTLQSISVPSQFVTMSSSSAVGWYGFGLAFAYNGPRGTTNAQPNLSYTCEMDYYCTFRGQLF